MENILKLSDLGKIKTQNMEFITIMFCNSKEENTAIQSIQKIKGFSDINTIYGKLSERIEVFKIEAENDKVVIYATEIK